MTQADINKELNLRLEKVEKAIAGYPDRSNDQRKDPKVVASKK